MFQHGDTSLILAAKEGHPGVVKALLSKYADLELHDSVRTIAFSCV